MGNIPRPQSKQPVPSDAKKVFGGIIFDVYQWEQELYDGTKATFEKLRRKDTAIVFPVLDDGTILLTEQEQPGKGSFIDAIGGRIEDGEDALGGIRRELLEESGYTAETYILWDARQLTSKIDYVVYTFIAKGLKKVSDVHLDAGEKITLKPVTFEAFIDAAIDHNLIERALTKELFEAKLHPEKMEKLRELFKPI